MLKTFFGTIFTSHDVYVLLVRRRRRPWVGPTFLFGLTSCLAKLCLRTFVRKLYSVHCVHTRVSTEEMFSAANYFKYIQSGSGPRVVTQKLRKLI